jgi:hypothetical protein
MWVKVAGFNPLRTRIGGYRPGSEPIDWDTCFVRISETSRQSCEHLRPCYRTLTRLFKLIATA